MYIYRCVCVHCKKNACREIKILATGTSIDTERQLCVIRNEVKQGQVRQEMNSQKEITQCTKVVHILNVQQRIDESQKKRKNK